MQAQAAVTASREPTDDDSSSAVHNRLFFRLFQSANTLDRQAGKELGVSPVHWAVLGALSGRQAAAGMSFSDLAQHLLVSRQSLDGVLKRLERDGHAVRVADRADRRVRKVVLTAQGRRAWNKLLPRIHEFYRQALDGFKFDDKVALLHFLNRLNEGMRHVVLAGGGPGPAAAAVAEVRRRKPGAGRA